MTKARNLADLLNANGQIDNADIADNTISNAKLAQTPNFRNIIINGDMSIAQRGTSATGLGNGDSGYYTVDRWIFTEFGAPTYEFTQTQDTDVPTGQGFATSLKMDCTTAQGSLAAGDAILIQQKIEGQNLQYLKKGTANAESVTMSFWVKSNKTGNYIVELRDTDNSRTINKSYTIDSASTWEKKTITFEGDTTGTLDNDNGGSLDCNFWLGAGTTFTSGTLQTSWGSLTNANRAVGQVNLADSTSNDWYITGVQLEAGTSASDFEFLPYDVNLARCYRYYYQDPSVGIDTPYATATYNTIARQFFMPVVMRAVPTIAQVGGVVVKSNISAVNTFTTDAGTSSTKQYNFFITATGTARTYLYRPVQFSSEL